MHFFSDTFNWIHLVLNVCSHLYAKATKLDYVNQSNYVCLKSHLTELMNRIPALLNKRQKELNELREQAKVTESTLQNAVCIKSLKSRSILTKLCTKFRKTI